MSSNPMCSARITSTSRSTAGRRAAPGLYAGMTTLISISRLAGIHSLEDSIQTSRVGSGRSFNSNLPTM